MNLGRGTSIHTIASRFKNKVVFKSFSLFHSPIWIPILSNIVWFLSSYHLSVPRSLKTDSPLDKFFNTSGLHLHLFFSFLFSARCHELCFNQIYLPNRSLLIPSLPSPIWNPFHMLLAMCHLAFEAEKKIFLYRCSLAFLWPIDTYLSNHRRPLF